MTNVQSTVVQTRQNQGYTVLGRVGESVLIVKGRHTILINSFGYDEHIPGLTYKVEEYECSKFV